jgi:glycosyltransferase involved in cell wall biosynthesis
MTRLVAVSPLAEVAGGEVMLLRLLPQLAERGWSVRLATPGGGPLREAARAAGIETASLPLGPPARRTLSSYVGAAVSPLVTRGAEVVLLNGLSTQRLVPVIGRRGARALLHVDNPLDEAPRAWARAEFWDCVRGVLTDSRYSARQCVDAGAPEDRVHAVWPPAWAPGERPPAPGRGGGGRVGFVGQLERRKGVVELARAAAAFLGGRPEASLTIVGEPPAGGEGYEDELRRAVANSGVAERIELAGFRPDAAAAMRGFDVLAVPSFAEPFGTVAAEAAAAGVPVVASRVGGLTEVVLDGETGVLVEPGDPGALAAAIGAVLDDPPRRQAMAERAYAESERFAPERYADRVEELLREAAR